MTTRTLLRKITAASAATVALLAAGPAMVGVANGMAGPEPRPQAPSAQIDDVRVSPGQARISLTTSDMPNEVSLSDADVRVTLNDSPVPAEVTSQDRDSTGADQDAPPRSAMLLLDTSGSMAGTNLTAARTAALRYLDSVSDDVLVGLITFADQPALVVRPTADREPLRGGLDGLRADGETALHDAVALGVSTLDEVSGAAQRRLVVLSDGIDTVSESSLDTAGGLLGTHDVAVDVVAFQYKNKDISAVRALAAAGNGRVLTANDAGQLSAAFQSIARRFTERAVVTATIPDAYAGESVLLRVRVDSEAGAFGASKDVNLAGLAAPSADEPWYAALLPETQEWTWQLWAVIGVSFATLLLVGLVLLTGVGRTRDTGARIARAISQYGADRAPGAQETREENPFARSAVGLTEQMLRSGGWEAGLAERLDLAGIRMKPAEWTLLRVCAGVVLIALVTLLGMPFLVSIVLGALVTWAVTWAVVRIRISRRRAAFADQLPDVLQLIAGSLKSGFSLAQALDTVVRDNTQPAAGEISRALAETRIGSALEPALERVAARMASEDLRWIVMAIRIQREVGGNLAEVLLTTVTTMRERAQVRRQVRALSAEGRLSAYILIALPIAIGTFFVVTKPEYMAPLYTTAVGWLMLASSVLLMAVGAFWMSRLVKVEV